MERYRQVYSDAFFDEHEMTAYLPGDSPTGFLKCSGCVAAGDVAERAHGQMATTILSPSESFEAAF